jgi:hypothetical protein
MKGKNQDITGRGLHTRQYGKLSLEGSTGGRFFDDICGVCWLHSFEELISEILISISDKQSNTILYFQYYSYLLLLQIKLSEVKQ